MHNAESSINIYIWRRLFGTVC